MKPLPHSIEAEQTFLAHCLLGASKEAIELLSTDDFYRTAHQVVYSAIVEICKSGAEVGLVTVVEHLRNNGALDKAGGVTAVSSLTDMVSGIGLEPCAEIIRRAAARRKVIEACAKTQAACFESDDIDEIIGGLTTKITQAEQGLSDDQWVRIGDMTDAMIERWENGKGQGPTGYLTGLSDIDRAFGGLQPGLIVIGARPAMGKTALALKIAKNVAKYGVPVAFRSIEMAKEQLYTRTTADMAQVDSKRFRSGELDSSHWDRIVKAVGKIHNLPIYIDDRPTENIRNLQRVIRQFVKRYGKGPVIIDYLQYVEGLKSDRKDLEIGTITRGLKATSKELSIPIILLAQLNRDLERRTDKRPIKADLRGSGEIEQDADIIAFLYRDEVYNEDSKDKGTAEFIIDKFRDGKPGTIRLAWIDYRATFEDLAQYQTRKGGDPMHTG